MSCCSGKKHQRNLTTYKDIGIYVDDQFYNRENLNTLFMGTFKYVQKQYIITVYQYIPTQQLQKQYDDKYIISIEPKNPSKKTDDINRYILSDTITYDPVYQSQYHQNTKTILPQHLFDKSNNNDTFSYEQLVSEQVIGITFHFMTDNEYDPVTIEKSQSFQETQEGQSKNLINILAKIISQNNFRAQYKIVKELGEGGSSVVYLVINRKTNQTYAVKISNKKVLQQQQNAIKALFQEINIMKNFDHPNIIKLIDSFHDITHFYIIIELQEGGTLKQRIQNQQCPTIPTPVTKINDDNYFTTKQSSQKSINDTINQQKLHNPQTRLSEIQNIIRQVLQGLVCIHEKGIMHRDIKPENLLFKNDQFDQIIISDFGLATKLNIDRYLFPRAGTPSYCSPEIYSAKKNSKYTEACDIYSLGIVLYELIFESLPFQSLKEHQQYLKSSQSLVLYKDLKNQISKYATSQAIDLINVMVQLNPKQRVTAKEALNHPFLQKTYNPISQDAISINSGEEKQSYTEFNLDTKKMNLIQTLKNQNGNLKIQNRSVQSNDNKNPIKTLESSSTTVEFVTTKSPQINMKFIKEKNNFTKSIALGQPISFKLQKSIQVSQQINAMQNNNKLLGFLKLDNKKSQSSINDSEKDVNIQNQNENRENIENSCALKKSQINQSEKNRLPEKSSNYQNKIQNNKQQQNNSNQKNKHINNIISKGNLKQIEIENLTIEEIDEYQGKSKQSIHQYKSNNYISLEVSGFNSQSVNKKNNINNIQPSQRLNTNFQNNHQILSKSILGKSIQKSQYSGNLNYNNKNLTENNNTNNNNNFSLQQSQFQQMKQSQNYK